MLFFGNVENKEIKHLCLTHAKLDFVDKAIEMDFIFLWVELMAECLGFYKKILGGRAKKICTLHERPDW